MGRNRLHVTDEERAAINTAVADAERTCSAEMVPALAAASGRYDRAEDFAGLTLAIAFFLAAWILFQRDDPTAGGWDGPTIALQWPALLAVFVGGYFLGMLIAGNVWFIRRLFTPRRQMRSEVLAKARQVFFDQRIHHARSSAGILFFVSLYEREALLVADQRAMEALGQAGLDQLRDDLIGRLRREPLAQALAAVIRAAAERLKSSLPPGAADTNELPDALIVVE